MANNTDQEINDILDKLYESEDYNLFSSDLYGDTPMMNNSVRRLDNIIQDKGLIEQHKEARMLTDFGLRICENGGWIKYCKEVENQQIVERDRQSTEDEKLRYDAKISKYLYKTRWWPLIISLISLGIALWSFFS